MKLLAAKQLRLLITSLTLLGFASCSTRPYVQEIPVTANVVEEINDLKTDLSFASQDQVDVLSPNNYKEAQEHFVDAQKSLDKQNDPKVTLHHVALGKAYLKRANEVKQLSNTKMDEVVIARKQALDAGAMTSFEKDFSDADRQLKSVTSDLEKNKTESTEKYRSKLQKNYLDLELRGIKYTNLNPSEVIINKSIIDGAKKIAPQSLAIAEKNYQDADAYITANRHNDEQIRIISQNVFQEANHVMKITHDSLNTKKASPEEIALQMEKRDHQIKDGEENYSNEKKLSGTLSQENDQLKDEALSKDDDIVNSAQIATSLSRENYNLQSEKEINEKYESAQKLFTKSEAEVYKQGRTLTIRLRGLEFPSSGAKLKQSNTPLLNKVQTVLNDFDSKSIVVEGHTDSVGSEEANNKLSASRALAVKNYLIEKGAVSEDSITSVGQGFKKPLATNKSVSGRAQNRRVDLLISL